VPVAAALLGSVVVVGDSLMTEVGERAKARAEAARRAAQEAAATDSPDNGDGTDDEAARS